MELEGKVALVTGGGHRVGRAILLALARAGADVVLHYHHSQKQAEATQAELHALGRRVLLVRADLSRVEEIGAMFAEVRRAFPVLHVLVNSAAIMEAQPVDAVTPADWDRTLDLNLRAPFFCAQQAAQLMTQGGVIVNIGDVAGMQPWARYPVHSVSKAGVAMLTQVLARALAPRVRVNAVAPGPVARPSDLGLERWQAIARRLPLRRAGSPEDVAQAVLYLVQAEFVTGTILAVDGGAHLV
jgi:pteridine reductase